MSNTTTQQMNVGTGRVLVLGTLNGDTPLSYRIGTTDRAIGEPALDIGSPVASNPVYYPEGFLVYNSTNGNWFVVNSGLWASGSANTTLLAAWFATTTTNPGPGVGYRIGTTDRSLGDSTDAPDGFLVLNTTSNAVFLSSGGIWVDGGTFPSDLLDAWLAA